MIDKLVPRSEAAALGKRLRSEGRVIVFANGCFDLLHVGHIRFLREAREQGDVLVVGVNSDRSVAALKGPGRPLMPEIGRAELVAALECVDYVIVFDNLTAESLLADLRPHVHCKGADYTEESVPERRLVQELGGAIRITGDAKQHSTREILADIRKRFAKH